MPIYKILRRPEWDAFRAAGEIRGAPVDLADGFIHFSTAAQLAQTAARHFRDESDLVLLAIEAGALGPDMPSADLVVSPQHRILLRSRVALRMFGTDEILVAAKQLLQIEGVDLATDLAEVEYVHILFDQHEVVRANGTATESLYLGPRALAALPATAVEEILAIFPELTQRTHAPAGARMLASGRKARKLAHRHSKNGQPLVLA